MIPRGPEITVFRVPLESAGEMILRQTCGYFHLWQFEKISDGTPMLDGVVGASFGAIASADDAVPMGYNTRIQFRPVVELITLRWVAQQDTRAVFVMSPSPDALEGSNVPARQIVFQGQATNFGTLAFNIGPVRTTVAPSRPSRQRIVFQAGAGNSDRIFLGTSGVLVGGNAIVLEPGASFEARTSEAISAIAATDGQILRRWEETA